MVTDAFNREIQPGQLIMYNLSGDLAIGVVTKVHEQYTTRYNTTYFTGYIAIDVLQSATFPRSHKSKVRNPRSTAVVDTQWLAQYERLLS
jgi:hypothetical protein